MLLNKLVFAHYKGGEKYFENESHLEVDFGSESKHTERGEEGEERAQFEANFHEKNIAKQTES